MKMGCGAVTATPQKRKTSLREEFEATLRDRDAQIAALKEAGAEAARLSGTVQSLRDEIASRAALLQPRISSRLSC